jgi:hypothetical protein
MPSLCLCQPGSVPGSSANPAGAGSGFPARKPMLQSLISATTRVQDGQNFLGLPPAQPYLTNAFPHRRQTALILTVAGKKTAESNSPARKASSSGIG